MAAKALTIRLPHRVYEESREVAQQQNISLNKLILKSIETIIKAHEKQQLFDAFSMVGEDREEASVEFASHAQREVVQGEFH